MYGELYKKLKEAFKGVKKARPSLEDIRMVFYREVLELRKNPFVHIDHKICSEYGVTESHLTPEAIGYFVKDKNEFLTPKIFKDFKIEKDNGEIFLENKFLSIHFTPYTNKYFED